MSIDLKVLVAVSMQNDLGLGSRSYYDLNPKPKPETCALSPRRLTLPCCRAEVIARARDSAKRGPLWATGLQCFELRV